MTRMVRAAQLPYAAENLFAPVGDVARYPRFLPRCASAEVMSADAASVVAALTVRQGRISERFVTCNSRHFPERIELGLVDGPFRRFFGLWSFTSRANCGCKVELDLDFAISRGIAVKMLAAFYCAAAGSLVDAFWARARSFYR